MLWRVGWGVLAGRLDWVTWVVRCGLWAGCIGRVGWSIGASCPFVLWTGGRAGGVGLSLVGRRAVGGEGGLPIGVWRSALWVVGQPFWRRGCGRRGTRVSGRERRLRVWTQTVPFFVGSANLFEVHDEAFAAGDEGAEAADLADGVVEVAGEGDEVAGVDGESLALGDT